MTVENQLETIIKGDADLDLDLLESVRQKIAEKTALTEGKKEDDESKKPADEQDETPAVAVENPINPDLSASDQNGDGIDDSQEQGEEDDKKKPEETVTESTGDSDALVELLGEEFSDEFKLKAAVIFDAAVKQRVAKIEESLKSGYASKAATLEESFNVRLVEETTKIEEALGEEINGYLTLMSEEWMSKHELAIQAGIKAELVESFIGGMKTLFEEHYVDLPEERLDVIGKIELEKAALSESLEEANAKLAQLTEAHNTVLRGQIIAESTKDFTGLDFERFKTLTEDFAFESEDMFRKKVSIIKTAFFEAKAEKSHKKETSLMEAFVPTAPIVEEKTIDVDAPSAMDTYVKFLGKKK